jgi:transcriptional regulator with XRE-family HTH domain
MELKNRIREAMEGAGLKPLQLAVKTGKTSGAITHWLTGATRSLKAETAAKIEAATGYSAAWIVSGNGEKLVKSSTGPRRMGDGLSPGAIEIAALYDLIPIGDQIRRVQAYNAATAAILSILEPVRSTAVQATDQ